MHRIKMLGFALVAMFAFSALAASGASAAELLWLVNGKHLKEGETRLLLVTAKEKFELTASATKIKCEKLTLPNGENMDLVGPDKNKEILLFTSCSVEGNGSPCTVDPVETGLIVSTLGFPTAAKKGPILVLFEPAGANHANNKVFTTIKFLGTGCLVPTLPVIGQQIGEAYVNEHPVETPEDALHGEVKFSKPGPKTIFINKETVKTKLEVAGGVAATLTGTALLLVDENGLPVTWGILW